MCAQAQFSGSIRVNSENSWIARSKTCRCFQRLPVREGRCIPGVDLEGTRVIGNGFVKLQISPPSLPRNPERGIVRLQSQGMIEVSHRALVHSLCRPRLGACDVVGGVLGVEPDGFGVIGDFPITIVLFRPGLGSRDVGGCVIGIELDRLVKVGEGAVVFFEASRSSPCLTSSAAVRGSRLSSSLSWAETLMPADVGPSAAPKAATCITTIRLMNDRPNSCPTRGGGFIENRILGGSIERGRENRAVRR